jgi:hypothetical protein
MRRTAVLAAALAAAAFPASAHAAWTSPVQVYDHDDANALAQSAFGGSIAFGWDERVAAVAKRDGNAFTPPAPITVADPFETVWDTGLDADGDAVVLSLS